MVSSQSSGASEVPPKRARVEDKKDEKPFSIGAVLRRPARPAPAHAVEPPPPPPPEPPAPVVNPATVAALVAGHIQDARTHLPSVVFYAHTVVLSSQPMLCSGFAPVHLFA